MKHLLCWEIDHCRRCLAKVILLPSRSPTSSGSLSIKVRKIEEQIWRRFFANLPESRKDCICRRKWGRFLDWGNGPRLPTSSSYHISRIYFAFQKVKNCQCSFLSNSQISLSTSWLSDKNWKLHILSVLSVFTKEKFI